MTIILWLLYQQGALGVAVGLRETKRRRQHRQLVDCAIALLRERGYDRTRVQDIIERAEVSEATFFNYFPTKDAVLEAFALDRVDRYGHLLKNALQGSRRTGTARQCQHHDKNGVQTPICARRDDPR